MYRLAEKLHMTVGQVLAMPRVEFLGWLAWYEVKDNLADLAARTQEHRR